MPLKNGSVELLFRIRIFPFCDTIFSTLISVRSRAALISQTQHDKKVGVLDITVLLWCNAVRRLHFDRAA